MKHILQLQAKQSLLYNKKQIKTYYTLLLFIFEEAKKTVLRKNAKKNGEAVQRTTSPL